MRHTRHLELDLAPGPNGLMRIVAVCHRRRCDILELHYQHHSDGDPCRVRLAVAADDACPNGIEEWLANVVDVRALRPTSPT